MRYHVEIDIMVPCTAAVVITHLPIMVDNIGVAQLVVFVIVWFGEHVREGLRQHQNQEADWALNVRDLQAQTCMYDSAVIATNMQHSMSGLYSPKSVSPISPNLRLQMIAGSTTDWDEGVGEGGLRRILPQRCMCQQNKS
jgi:hypothetical protein